MPAAAYTRNQRCYPVLESVYGTAISPANGDCCLIATLATQSAQNEIQRPDKTGSLGELVGIPGRRTATWSATMSTAGSGAAGTVPDMDVLLQILFGKAAAVVSSTSVTYGLDDTQFSASIWHYNAPAGVCQYVALGAVANQGRFSFGGDVPMLELSGPAHWAYDSDQQADGATDAAAKGGIAGALPAEPSAPVTNGKPPAGFTGAITLDGNSFATIRTVSINLAVARELPGDIFNNYYSGDPAAGIRTVTFDMGLYDDDSSILRTLKQKSFTKSLIDCIFQWGTVAGNIWTVTLKNVMLPVPAVDYGSIRRALTFTGCRAHDTSIGAKDAMKLVLT